MRLAFPSSLNSLTKFFLCPINQEEGYLEDRGPLGRSGCLDKLPLEAPLSPSSLGLPDA